MLSVRLVQMIEDHAEELELALAESGGSWTFGCDLHMSVMIHT